QAVIAGLDPAIHPLRKKFSRRSMDPRVKPAGDGERLRPIRVKPAGDAGGSLLAGQTNARPPRCLGGEERGRRPLSGRHCCLRRCWWCAWPRAPTPAAAITAITAGTVSAANRASTTGGAPATPKVRDKIAGRVAGKIRPKISRKTSDKIRTKIKTRIA